jgi:clan AA aspartic protease
MCDYECMISLLQRTLADILASNSSGSGMGCDLSRWQQEVITGKVVETVKITNLLDPTKSVEVEAVVDTGAMMMVLPKNIVSQLGLERIEEVRVRYADNRVGTKEIYGGVKLELKGRVGIFDVLAENEGSQPLIGQIILERLDLVIDPSTRKIVPNPRSPEMPMVEIFAATSIYEGVR